MLANYNKQCDDTIFDCGWKEGFIKANVSFALTREDIREKVEDDLRRMLEAL